VFAVDSEKDGQEWFAGFMALCQVRVVQHGDCLSPTEAWFRTFSGLYCTHDVHEASSHAGVIHPW
jgi:hypothetical protein